MPRRRITFERRTLLAGLSALPLGRAWAFGEASTFIPALAQHGAKWDARSSGLRRMAYELQRRTSVEVGVDVRPMPLSSPKLFEHPFLYFGGQGDLPPLKAAEVETLRRYLTFGGFILADANDGSSGSDFDTGFRREMARVLPQSPFTPVASNHVLFKSFYLLDTVPGRLLKKPQLDACWLGKRAGVVYSQNDLLGALNRDEGGAWEYDCTPGGERQREYAMRLAINVAMYALCLDYKDDAVHLPLIMKRRR